MLSTVEESMYWVLKVWSAVHKQIREMGHLRLNFIDDYNNNMNGADIRAALHFFVEFMICVRSLAQTLLFSEV